MILNFFAESIGEPGKSPHRHPHREILTLDVRMVCFATPVMRSVARIETPSTNAEITWTRFSRLRRFISTSPHLSIREQFTYVKQKVRARGKIFSLAFLKRFTYYRAMSKTRLPAKVREYFSRLGKKGGPKGGAARAAKMTPEERRESARKAVLARWAKKKAL